jgi:hypothetical protein
MDQHAVAGYIKNTGDTQLRTLQKTAIAVALLQFAASCGACEQAAPASAKNENVVIK